MDTKNTEGLTMDTSIADEKCLRLMGENLAKMRQNFDFDLGQLMHSASSLRGLEAHAIEDHPQAADLFKQIATLKEHMETQLLSKGENILIVLNTPITDVRLTYASSREELVEKLMVTMSKTREEAEKLAAQAVAGKTLTIIDDKNIPPEGSVTTMPPTGTVH